MTQEKDAGKPVVADLAKIEKKTEVVVPELLDGDEKRIEDFIARIKSVGENDPDGQSRLSEAAKSFASGHIAAANQKNEMLRKPLSRYSGDESGKGVADSLVALADKVAEVNPAKFDLNVGTLRRLFSKLPFIGDPVKNYLDKFMQAEEVIAAIDQSLASGRESLVADNEELEANILSMRESCVDLKRMIKFGETLRDKVNEELSAMPEEDPAKRFVAEEILFPVNQGVMDVQELLAVTQQGVLAYGIITENNRQLVRGIDRARNTTVAALKIGATMAVALSNQKEQLDKLNQVNATTSDLIAGNARQLKEQGVAIQRQASSSSLDVSKLEAAINDTLQAVNDVSAFRVEAISMQDEQIRRFDSLIATGEEAVLRAKDGLEARNDLLAVGSGRNSE